MKLVLLGVVAVLSACTKPVEKPAPAADEVMDFRVEGGRGGTFELRFRLLDRTGSDVDVPVNLTWVMSNSISSGSEDDEGLCRGVLTLRGWRAPGPFYVSPEIKTSDCRASRGSHVGGRAVVATLSTGGREWEVMGTFQLEAQH